MPGSWINHVQKDLYMTSRQTGDSQERAASRSGFSDRSGRRIEKGEGGPTVSRAVTAPVQIRSSPYGSQNWYRC